MSPQKFIVLIMGMIVGFFMLLVPSPIDIGESILLQITNLDLCTSEQCVENQSRIISYYNIGGMIIGIGSIIGLFKGFRG